ncbi:unnamed protein product [Adineta steineri]|uniref:NAD(P)(+)--arginine ADP-ribosyltransferase n=1 Tax=Adineta steineri TaxID=433720 RepID=A0A815NQT7_9BILA|nr:unnamed protein product [Adineta steineri]CAF4151276.1 unnamed protein product [Adineta steineri]
MASTDNLNQLDPTFMYTQLFKEILLNMKHNSQAIKDFITYCRQNNYGSPINIDRFEKEYCAQSAIWWYTYPSFIYYILNYALRSMIGDTIINMGFLIHDLHQQIQQLHQQQVNSYSGKPFIVYRGQGLPKAKFEKLKKSETGLMSFNNFLSTTKDKEISIGFAHIASTEPDKVGILFVMSIDPCLNLTPFASIKEESYFKEEEEILFSMHTVFRVGAIKQMDNNNELYQVELQLTSDDDLQLRLLTDRIREEAGGGTERHRLGNLLLKIGQFNKAEELHSVLLEQASDQGEKAIYYQRLGLAQLNQGDYERAIWYYKKALEIQEKTLPSNHPDFATSYNNIGSVYDNMGEYPKALSFYEKALKIQQKTLPSYHPDVATSYNNIGTLETRQKTLPSSHPDLATSYNNIGSVYDNMREYSKAFTFIEKALEIYQKTLPSNHPDLTTSYSNTGLVYTKMEEYSKALAFFEKALELRQKTLPSNHPDLATSYSCMGSVYNNMKDYSKALSYYLRALDKFQCALPPTHPDIKMVKENIEIVKKKL